MEVKKIVGYLPENVGFYGDMDAEAEPALHRRAEPDPQKRSGGPDPRVLKLVGLSENGDKKVSAFSRGMKQRLGIAEVLLKDRR